MRGTERESECQWPCSQCPMSIITSQQVCVSAHVSVSMHMHMYVECILMYTYMLVHTCMYVECILMRHIVTHNVTDDIANVLV